MKSPSPSGFIAEDGPEVAPGSIPDHELLRRIGRGSYGEVWLARNRLGTMRAVKVVWRADFDEDRPYEREFSGIQKFEPISRSHDGFVDLLQVGRNDAQRYFYYVMELADRSGLSAKPVDSGVPTPTQEAENSSRYQPRTLAAEVKARGALPLDDCLRISRTLASALAELHGHGLVHRDIKPSNIIFVDGVPKLADIGLVAAVNEARSFVGTEGFIPPEGPGTPQADLYSLGIVLYVISTGKSHLDFPEPPADLATRPDREGWLELQAIIHRACQADPRLRYMGAAGMLDDLELIRTGKSVKYKHKWEQRWKAFRRVGIAAAFVTMLGGSTVMLRHQLKQSRPPSSDPEAVIWYEQAKGLLNQQDPHSRRLAYSALAEAVNHDPKFLAAYYMMFECYFWDDQLPPRTNQLANLKWVTEKMRALDANSAHYHTAAAWLKYLDWKWDEEIQHLKLALRANPDFLRAHGFYGGVLLRARGDPEAALREFKAAERSYGFDTIIQAHLGTPYYVKGDYTNAIAQYQKAFAFQNGAAGPWSFLGLAYEANGQYREALNAYEQQEKAERDANGVEIDARYKHWQAILSDKGPRDLWQAMLEHDQRWWPDSYEMAGLHARLGNKDEALAWLEKAFQEHHQDMPNLLVHHYWRPLYNEPRFQVIVKQMGFKPKR